jgi:hypothetical protein
VPELNELSAIVLWENSSPSDDNSDGYDWVLDSIMSASPIDQPTPIDIVVEPTTQSDD